MLDTPGGFFIGVCVVVFILFKLCGSGKARSASHTRSRLLRQYEAHHVSAIYDRFTQLEQVTAALRQAGLESSNLIFGVDYTASNEHQGQRTFGGRCLHYIERGQLNPYQQVIQILGRTLEPFDDDGVIPAFGFGDVVTGGHGTFPLTPTGYCHGFEEVLTAYGDVTPRLQFSGPTNFAPLIKHAISIVQQTKAYHILVIIADGQVTSEKATRQAIVEASNWPLSIIVVGVGDGPWDMMRDFDDKLPQRKFDNFQFVDFQQIMSSGQYSDSRFALHALMEIPDQFQAIRKLGYLDM